MINSSHYRRKIFDQRLLESDENAYKLKDANVTNQEKEGERKQKQKTRFLFDTPCGAENVLRIDIQIKASLPLRRI